MEKKNIISKKLANTSIIVRYLPLPEHIKGYTIKDSDDQYNIYLNSQLSYEQQRETFFHECRHIEFDDFFNDEDHVYHVERKYKNQEK